MSRWLSLAFALAGAEPTIEWHADPGCDQQDVLQQELSRYRLEQRDEPVQIRVDLRTDASGQWWVDLRLEFEDGRVERRFSADSCALATSATALMIAVALDPTGVLDELDEPERPEPEPAREPEPEPEPPEPEPPEPPEHEPPRRDLGLVAQLAGQAGLGPLPGFGGELFGSLGLRAGPTRVELLGNVGFPRVVRLDDSDAGVRLHYWSLGLRGCGEPSVQRVSLAFPLCLGAEFGPLTAEGFGLAENRRSSASFMAVTGGAGISWAPTRVFGVFLATQAWIGLARPQTSVEGFGVVHQVDQLGLRIQAGVEFRWPNNIGGRRPK